MHAYKATDSPGLSSRIGEKCCVSVAAAIENVHQALKTRVNECTIDDVIGLCPNLTWNQVFLAIDHMSRTGQVQLKMDRARCYRVKVLPSSQFRQDPIPIVA